MASNSSFEIKPWKQTCSSRGLARRCRGRGGRSCLRSRFAGRRPCDDAWTPSQADPSTCFSPANRSVTHTPLASASDPGWYLPSPETIRKGVRQPLAAATVSATGFSHPGRAPRAGALDGTHDLVVRTDNIVQHFGIGDLVD